MRSPTRTRLTFMQRFSRLHREESGFTIIEAMVATTLLVVGAFAIAQAIGYGLRATGISRQRLGAEALVQKQLELVRDIPYGSIALTDEPVDIDHSTDPSNPNFWVNSDVDAEPTYNYQEDSDPDHYQLLITDPVSGLGVAHLENFSETNSEYDIYRYVTWEDIKADGVGADDDADGDGDSGDVTEDANGQDAKRLTVVVTWADPFSTDRALKSYKSSVLFSTGTITFGNESALANQAPTVGCPTAPSLTNPVSFSVVAGDADGTIEQVDWDFGDGVTSVNGGAGQTHDYAASGTYTVNTTVTDDGGLTATTSGCTYNVVVPIPVPEYQLVTLSGATGGTFRITFNGQQTAAINWNAPASGANSVQKALKDLNNVSSGDITVTGSAGGPYTLVFGGSYAFTDVPQVTVTDNLTPTAATVTATTTQDGVTDGSSGGGSVNAPGGSITINAAATATNNLNVTLTLAGVPGTSGSPVTHMRFNETGAEEDYGAWETYSASKPYTFVGSTNGTRSVYVQFKDANGRVGEDKVDTIFLDTVAPGTAAWTTSGLTSAARTPTSGNPALRNKGIALAWTTAADAAPSSGGTTYYPEYKIGAGSFTAVPGSIGCPAASTTALNMTCNPVPNGSPQYTFRIKAIDPAGNIRYSNERLAPA